MNNKVKTTPFFSIIIPIYNQDRFLSECLRSVVNQTFQDFECILVNDGSTDNSLEICRIFQKKYSQKFILKNKANEGVVETRRKGIEISRGKYIVFLDSDDKLSLNALNVLKNSLKLKKVDLLLFNLSKSEKLNVPMYSYGFETSTYFQGSSMQYIYQLILGTEKLNSLSSKCINRKLFSKIQESKNERSISTYEDFMESLKIVDNSNSVMYISDILYYYRENKTSVTSYYNRMELHNIEYVNKLRMKYALKWNHNDDSLIDLSNKMISKSYYVCIMSVINSELDLISKKKEIHRIRNSIYYNEYRGYTPNFKHFYKVLAFKIIKDNNLFGMILLILLKKIRGNRLKVR
ncbi:glycosyltransferase family 2 protein [Liquorilactobacillus capillatus]|uniref:Glycosyltransferase 2-like domain-containing protein n=1 Tax=Liquorilactobacillus capillatus DSM 19910 TaxID=1423731 RepID=A0A0R1MG18_9LACO|nr:glycosyltransferase family A protein [Liquorilactobacillus capillatus]KRL02600.1 hypothetical protein FC81_GL000637 [Liquorilactobacillus capillatus DSM 19910]